MSRELTEHRCGVLNEALKIPEAPVVKPSAQ